MSFKVSKIRELARPVLEKHNVLRAGVFVLVLWYFFTRKITGAKSFADFM